MSKKILNTIIGTAAYFMLLIALTRVSSYVFQNIAGNSTAASLIMAFLIGHLIGLRLGIEYIREYI